jgi:hypothetical protein
MTVTDPLALAALTLLHILVLVYWLGGDLGAFVTSHLLSQSKLHPQARFAAARILGDVDMAPRSALVLAFPTGLVLMAAKGLAVIPAAAIGASAALGLGWLALVWWLHLRHAGASSILRRVDLGLRWLAFLGLGGLALGLIVDWPLYIRLKCLALAGAILCGLAIRAYLAPFSKAMAGLAAGAPSPEDNAAIKRALDNARPIVVLIWALVAAAAFLGVWRPV